MLSRSRVPVHFKSVSPRVPVSLNELDITVDLSVFAVGGPGSVQDPEGSSGLH